MDNPHSTFTSISYLSKASEKVDTKSNQYQPQPVPMLTNTNGNQYRSQPIPILSNVNQYQYQSKFCALQESDHLKSIFSSLTGKQISKACHVAQQHGDYRLSLLLSQVTGNSVTRNLIYKQLSDWQEMKVCVTIANSVKFGSEFSQSFGKTPEKSMCQKSH